MATEIIKDSDVEWELVDPCAYSSLKMALAMGPQLERAEEYVAALGEARDDCVNLNDDEEAGGETAARGEEGGGMDDTDRAASSMMMQYTSEEFQWTLTRISKRRRVKVSHVHATDLIDEEHSLTDLEYEYLCHWRNTRSDATEISWETRGWLLDNGYGKLVEAEDTRRQPALRSEPGEKVPFRSISSLADRLRQTLPPDVIGVLGAVRQGPPFAVVPDDAVIDSVTYFVRTLVNGLYCVNRYVGEMCYFRPENLDLVLKKARNGCRLVYHGTSTHCMAGPNGITHRGLRAAGTVEGAVMRHGAAYGCGIYAAYDMRVAEGYASDVLLVCFAVSRPVTTTESFGVYGSHEDVCPFLRLTVTPRSSFKRTVPNAIMVSEW